MQAGYPEVVSSEIAQSGRRRRHGNRKATLRRAVIASAPQALRSRRPHACIETSRARTEMPRGRPWSVGHGPLGEGEEL